MGVKADFLLSFIEEYGGRQHFTSLSTTDVNEQIVQPATAEISASYCELLRCTGRGDLTADATVFISHAWKYTFLDVVDSILAFVEKEKENGAIDVVIWFDLFSNSQHGTSAKPFEWWQGTFKNAIANMGNVLMVMSPWDNPITLTRAWCVFEVYACVKTNSRFEVGMTREENERFLKDIKGSTRAYSKMLGTINSRMAQAFKPEDKDAIFAVIEKEVGFTEMDSMVLRALEGWMVKTIRKQASASKTDHDTLDEALYTGLLGKILNMKGQFEESLEMCNSCLEKLALIREPNDFFILRNLDEKGNVLNSLGRRQEALSVLVNCLERCRASLGSENDLTCEVMNDLAMIYDNIGKPEDAEPLYMECLDTFSRLKGHDHYFTLTTMNNLAFMFKNLARFEESIAMFLDCFERRRLKLGEEHPDVLTVEGNLASVYELQVYKKNVLVTNLTLTLTLTRCCTSRESWKRLRLFMRLPSRNTKG